MAATTRIVTAVEQTDAANIPTSAVTVGATDAALVAANPGRVEVTICNDHATNVAYLALGATAVANQGVRLSAAGGSYTTNAYTGAIRAIASGAGTVLTIVEI